jgi:hypothetical protein
MNDFIATSTKSLVKLMGNKKIPAEAIREALIRKAKSGTLTHDQHGLLVSVWEECVLEIINKKN